MMSFWTFGDVFEEDGAVKEPFHGGFGLIAAGGIKKPSYAGFALLHRLGHERLANTAPNVLVTRREDGTLAVAAWNLVDPDQPGAPRLIRFEFRGVIPDAQLRLTRADAQHGNTLAAYEAMGSPRYPTAAQIRQLNAGAGLRAPQTLPLKDGKIYLELPPDGLALLEIQK